MLVYYIQNNIVCLLLLCSIAYIWKTKHLALPSIKKAFRRLIYTTIIMCVSDTLAWYSNGMIFGGARFVNLFSNTVYYLTVTYASFFWLKYINASIQPTLKRNSPEEIILNISIVFITVLIIFNPISHFFFSVDSNNVYHREAGIVVHWVVSWGYLLWATIHVLIAMYNAKTPLLRKQYMPMLWFIIFPILAALTQMFVYSISSTQCGITLSIVVIAITYLQNQIVRDPLTGLNNRNALDEHFRMLLEKPATNLFICLIDVDSFKSINDHMGHSEGDNAIKAISSALKLAINQFPGRLFLCRYGGDEFLLCGTDFDIDFVQSSLKRNIEKNLADYNNSEFKGYNLSVSMGVASGKYMYYSDIEKLINEADIAMYEEKKLKKSI